MVGGLKITQALKINPSKTLQMVDKMDYIL